MSSVDEQLIVLTGPNMAGKSTYLRQVAVITLMAQTGSYVPAESASIGLVDRIFTRVGLQDDLAAGQSTFMVEMVETASILNHATKRSLVVLDEIGRGTSTYDGLAIARAVAEHIHNHPDLGCKTLFATHYHELTALAGTLPRARNYNVAVSEDRGEVVFLRRIVPGGADRSYGVHVARLAGLPGGVVNRAWEVLKDLEGGPGSAADGKGPEVGRVWAIVTPAQLPRSDAGGRGEPQGAGRGFHDAHRGDHEAIRAAGARPERGLAPVQCAPAPTGARDRMVRLPTGSRWTDAASSSPADRAD